MVGRAVQGQESSHIEGVWVLSTRKPPCQPGLIRSELLFKRKQMSPLLMLLLFRVSIHSNYN